MLKYVFITLIVLATFSEATNIEEEYIRKLGWDKGELANITNLRISPSESIQEMVELVQEEVLKFQFKSAVQINSTVKFKKVSSHKIPFSIISGWNKLLCYGMSFISYLFYWFIALLGKINENGTAHRTFPFS